MEEPQGKEQLSAEQSEVLSQFQSFTASSNRAACVEFLSGVYWNLEAAVGGFFELSEADSARFRAPDPEALEGEDWADWEQLPEEVRRGAGNGGGGEVDIVVAGGGGDAAHQQQQQQQQKQQRRSLVCVTVLEGEGFRVPQQQQKGGQQQRSNAQAAAHRSGLHRFWRLNVTLNEEVAQSRVVTASASPEWNQRFVSSMSGNDFGIFLAEVRTLGDAVVASGGMELSFMQDSSPEGTWIEVSSPLFSARLHVHVQFLAPGADLRALRSFSSPQRSVARPQKARRFSSGSLPALNGVVLPDSRAHNVLVDEEEGKRELLQLQQRKREEEEEDLTQSGQRAFEAGKFHWYLKGCPAPSRFEVQCNLCEQLHPYWAVMRLSACGHQAGKACLAGFVWRRVLAKAVQHIACQTCKAPLEESDVRQLLDRQQLEAYSELQLERLFEEDATFIRCPNDECRTPMERVLTASVDLENAAEAVGPDGGKLTGETLHHYNRYRMRCYACQSSFCAECKALPYHAGFTCETHQEFLKARHCRFCGDALGADVGLERSVCEEQECQDKFALSCKEVHAGCGHACGGVAGEKQCLPCLHEACEEAAAQQTGSDYCNICWVEDLSSAPTVRLGCGHLFHFSCVRDKIRGKWPGDRLTFGYMDCPLCKKLIQHPLLQDEIGEHLKLRAKIRENALKRLTVEGMEKDEKLTDPGSAYYKDPEKYAMHSFAYYVCFKCKKPYFGGRRDCEQNLQENLEKEELVCFDCSDMPEVKCADSAAHKEFHNWKCRYCCSMAVWRCWGTHSFCDPCHNKAWGLKNGKEKIPKCPGPNACPLKRDHAPNGEEFNLGCGMCGDNYSQKKLNKALDDEEEEEEKGKAEKVKEEETGLLSKLQSLLRSK